MLFQEYSLVPCRVYGEFLSFPELSHSQTQHSTDKLIPNFNFLAKTITFLSMFHFLFASIAAFFAGWSFMKKQIWSVYKNYSLCSNIESNRPTEMRMLTAILDRSWALSHCFIPGTEHRFPHRVSMDLSMYVMNVWLGPGYICEYQGSTSDYSIREIRLEPTAEDDNELSFASNLGLFIHPSEEELWAILPWW